MSERSLQNSDQGTLNAIRAWRSVRVYIPAVLDNDSIQILLNAAAHAPPAMHAYEFVQAVS